MKTTVSISEGQDSFPKLVKLAETGQLITIARHGEPVACVISHERMAAIVETLELMAVPAVIQAIENHKNGRTKFVSLDAIPE